MTVPEGELLPLLALTAEPTPGNVELVDGTGRCLPLTVVDIDAQICGLDARLAVRHTFTNALARPITATYVFPLPPRAAVRAFVATFAGRVVRARIDERDAARRAFDAAVREGKAAAIAEEDRPSTFTMTVGNIPPGTDVRCELECDMAVAVDAHPDGRGLEALLRAAAPSWGRATPKATPSTVEPAGFGVDPDTDAVPDASRVTPPRLAPGAARPHFRCRFTLDDAGMGASDVACTATASAATSSTGSLVIDVAPETRLDRDVTLAWRLAPRAVATTGVVAPDADGSGSATWELVVLPPVSTGPVEPARDVVVLLDRSGSMDGWKIGAARRLAGRIVDSLGGGDRFALAAFDDQIAEFRPGWTNATDEARFAASAWCAGIDSLGGTELPNALAHAAVLFATRQKAERRDAVLVVVTDGEITAEDRVSAIVTQRLADVRVFAIGVDTSANLGLLDRMARVSGGHTEIIDSPRRVDDVLRRVLDETGPPVLSDLTIEVPGGDPQSVAPRQLPNLYANGVASFSGRLHAGDEPLDVVVHGRRADGRPWRQRIVLTPITGAVADAVTGRWARARLLDMEDDWIAGESPLVDDIVALSRRWSVLSRFTAFVAVDEHGEVVSAPGIHIMQPLDLADARRGAAGWPVTSMGRRPRQSSPARAWSHLSSPWSSSISCRPLRSSTSAGPTRLLGHARLLRDMGRDLPGLEELIEALEDLLTAWTNERVAVATARIEALREVDDLLGKILDPPMESTRQRILARLREAMPPPRGSGA